MLTQLPSDIIPQIIECLHFSRDVRSLALVCSALRPHTCCRLFKVIRIFVEEGSIIPYHAELILFYPHLLQYVSSLLIWQPGRLPMRRSPREISAIPVHYLWTRLVIMHRVTFINFGLVSNYAGILSAMEGLDPSRRIALKFCQTIQPDIVLSEGSLPVRNLDLPLDQSGHRLGNQLLQKCSQSLCQLRLDLRDTSIPDFPHLPHVRIFHLRLASWTNNQDLTPWLPFFDQHPSLTHVSLDVGFTTVTLAHPTLLPNLQSLTAHPLIIERLIPGRPIHNVANFCPRDFRNCSVSYTTFFRSLVLSSVPLTTLAIVTDILLSTVALVDMIRGFPMLRNFRLTNNYEVCDWLKGGGLHIDLTQFPFAIDGILHALGKCRYLQHIMLAFTDPNSDTPDERRSFWSRADIVDMIAVIQESGADDLWSFDLTGDYGERREVWFAARVGWLGVASQPKLKGEWDISPIEYPTYSDDE